MFNVSSLFFEYNQIIYFIYNNWEMFRLELFFQEPKAVAPPGNAKVKLTFAALQIFKEKLLCTENILANLQRKFPSICY